MPVRSLNSHVLRWPDREAVIEAARQWAVCLLDSHPAVVRVGLFGSYAAARCGPGSDADLLIEVADSQGHAYARSLSLPVPRLPVPADVVVVTSAEVEQHRAEGTRWARDVLDATLWLAVRDARRSS